MVSLRIVTLNAQTYFVMCIRVKIYRRFIESLVNFYQTARRDILEDSIIYIPDHKNRKFHCPLILHFMFERVIKIIFSIK